MKRATKEKLIQLDRMILSLIPDNRGYILISFNKEIIDADHVSAMSRELKADMIQVIDAFKEYISRDSTDCMIIQNPAEEN